MDQEVTDKINKLEKELYEYQYNMGILLIEKKECVSKNEQFEHALAETTEILQREQTAHLLAMSEVDKREEKLRKALGVEKQCVYELEKALREMRSEYAEIKFTADSKLEEARSLSTSIEGRSLDVEAKLRAAGAKLAEISRKTSEFQRKSVEIESKESSLMRERMSFNNERDAHERNISYQREDLREWERKLQVGEEKLAELRRLINQREELANDNDKVFKQKQIDLEEAQKKIDLAYSELKTKENDIRKRTESLALKEKEAAAMRKELEVKEKELLEVEEKLYAREQVEIKKLLDEHKIILDAKTRDFELEMEKKRKSLNDDFKLKVVEVEKKEIEVNHLEGKIAKREQALENKLEKIKEKEKDFDLMSTALKKKEKSLKAEENDLQKGMKELKSEMENLLSLKAELQKLNIEIEEQKSKVNEDRERLQVTEEERCEYVRLQLELKQEIEKNRQEREGVLMETENLKQEKEIFEKEWEQLDEKREEIKKELESVSSQKEKFEKTTRLEEEKLNNLRLETEAYVNGEMESLNLAKETFSANMDHEKSVLLEKYNSKESQMLHEFEVKKQELDTELFNKQAVIENRIREQEKSFEKEKERELENLKYLREVASREMEEMKLERVKLEKEKNDISSNQKHLEGQQVEMKKDIDELVTLSVKLKDQREQFFKERERFVTFVEKQKGCKECGEIVSEFVLSDLQLAEIKNGDNFALPKLDGYMKKTVQDVGTSTGVGNNSGSPGSGSKTLTWFLKKCTSKVNIFSPGKKIEYETQAQEKLVDVGEIPEYILSSEEEREVSLSARVASDSFDVQRQVDQPEVEGKKASKKVGPRVTRARARKGASENNVSERGNGVAENFSGHTNEVSQGQGALKNGKTGWRKRASEQEPEYSEQSESVTAGGQRRNTKRKVVNDVEAPPVGRRYNLRQPKTGSPQSKEEGADQLVGSKRRVTGSKVQHEPSTSLANGNGDHATDSQVNKEDDIMALSEEVNGTPQHNREYDNDNDDNQEIETPAVGPRAQEEFQFPDTDNDSEDEVEVVHPGEVSIGRKLWTFIST